MEKITTLTKEQTDLCPVYVEKWKKIGLSSEPIDKEACIQAVNLVYKCGNLKPPKKVVFVRSPREGMFFYNHLKEFYSTHKGGNVEKLWQKMEESWEKIKDSFTMNKLEIPLVIRGCHEASWLAYYDYMINVLGVKLDNIGGLTQLAKECGWCIPLIDVCIVQERPLYIKLDQSNRLHCDDGPAIEYSDGFGVYSLEDINVTKEIIDKTFTLQDINKSNNAELRRILITRYGTKRYIEESKPTLIHSDKVCRVKGGAQTIPRALIQIGDLKWLVSTDGSTKRVYHMPVPIWVTTCKEAHQSISGLNEDLCIAQG